VRLPTAFCWTKYGTEAGEDPGDIIERKELERDENGGLFLWGVGNSILPSLVPLLEICPEPQVFFTPMLSRPRAIDAVPPSVVLWRRAIGFDQKPYDLPRASIVTSRVPRTNRSCHFALVCKSDLPLNQSVPAGGFSHGDVRNLRSGALVGASQVTSVVNYVGGGAGSRQYDVMFRATLVAPYFLRLSEPVRVSRGAAVEGESVRVPDRPFEAFLDAASSCVARRRSA
jgi:hypothetical protein